MTDPAPRFGGSRPAWRGELLLALLVLIATAVLVRAGGSEATRAEAGPGGGVVVAPPAPAGFRADAWSLPDDSLLGFVRIPAGPVRMGSDPAVDARAYENERWSASSVQGVVALPEYFIGSTEVTVAQYAVFVAATGQAVDPSALQAPPDHPVTHVSWPDALAYARWLESELRASDRTPEPIAVLLRAGGRVTLPSEAEWERAARGEDGRIFPWGDAPSRDRANFQSQGPLPVGSFRCPECPFPVHDLSGNVWEWTRSPFEPYPFDPAAMPRDLSVDALWVMRGGSFNDPPENLRAATRGGADPGARRPFLGFRVVIVPG